MNSSMRSLAARCADQSTSSGSSSARVKSGDSVAEQVLELVGDPRAAVHAVRDRGDRHLVDRAIRPEPMPHLARDRPVELGHAVRPQRRPQRERGQPEHGVVRLQLAELGELVPGQPALRATRWPTFRSTSSGSKTSLPAGDRRVRREHRRAAQPLERLRRCRGHPPRRARAGARPGGTPSAPRSCGRPSARGRACAARARRRPRARAPGAAGSRDRRRTACRWRRAPSRDCPRPSCRGDRATRGRPSRARRRAGWARACRRRSASSTTGAIGTSVSGSRFVSRRGYRSSWRSPSSSRCRK